MKRTRISISTVLVILACSAVADAQLKWPISVKFVYDADGNPPGNDPDCLDPGDGSAISCEAEVLEKIEYANQVLAKLGRGYTFDVIEMVHWTDPPTPDVMTCIGGADNGVRCEQNGPAECACPSDCCYGNGTPGCGDLTCEGIVCGVDPFCCSTLWDQVCVGEAMNLCGELCSNIPCTDGTWQQEPFDDWATLPAGPSHSLLGCVARFDPDSDGDGLSDIYQWREGTINTYIINENGGGVCGPRRCHSADISVTVIGQGANGANVRPFHEYVHCLGLCHTHGCSWATCCHDSDQDAALDSGSCSGGTASLGQDCLADTLPDNRTCETLEGLVQENFDAGNLSQPMYDDLPCEERQAVITTLYNIISYHMDDNDERICDGTEPLIQCDCDEPSPYGCPSSAQDAMR
jgi:hypothetical protein